jgi:WD40 repeat protein
MPLLADRLAGWNGQSIDAPAAITAHAVSHDGRLVALATSRRDRPQQPGEVRLYHWESLGITKLRHVFTGHSVPVRAVAFSADGAVLATADTGGTVKLWDVATGKERATLPASSGAVLSLALSADGTLLAVGNEEGILTVWQTATHQQRFRCQAHKGGVLALTFSPDGSRLVSGGGDRAVTVRDSESGKEKGRHQDYAGPVSCLDFSPDGKLLAVAGGETASLLDALTLKELKPLTGHAGKVVALAFSRDGKLLATAGADHSVKLRDPGTGQVTSERNIEMVPLSLVFGRNGAIPMALAVTPSATSYAAVAGVDLWEVGTGPITLR